MNLLALNLRILVNPPLQNMELDRNRSIGLDIIPAFSFPFPFLINYDRTPRCRNKLSAHSLSAAFKGGRGS